MKIIIIILICLFFSLSIPNINEFLTDPTGAQQLTTATGSQQPADPNEAQQSTTTSGQSMQPTQPAQPQADGGGLQTQVNMLSTQITTTNAIALESKKKVDDISSQIEQLKEQLQKAPSD